MMPKLPLTVAIIQARMGSSRLPGKVLLDLGGRPMLAWVVTRTRQAKSLAEVLVATTTSPEDDPVVEFCAARGYACTRGSVLDVLDRYVQAAHTHEADIVVRITADCPFIDPDVIDRTVHALVGNYQLPITDFACNRLPPPWGRTLPIGLDVEVVTMAALEKTWREATAKPHREHVMPYFYEDLPPDSLAPRTPPPAPGPWQITRATSPRGFRLAQLHHTPSYGALRWTVDTPEDLLFAREVAANLPGGAFPWEQVLALLERNPALSQINAHVAHKSATDIDPRTTQPSSKTQE